MKRFFAALLFALLSLSSFADAKGLFVYQGGSWHTLINPYVYQGGYQIWKRGWVFQSGSWQPFYSTVTVSASNVSGSNSGASSSGSVTSNTPGTSTGGNPIGSPTFAWSYVSGDGGISPSSSSAQNPTWSETVGGAACQSSASTSATWHVIATDPSTGAVSSAVNISISLTWNNTTSCFTPHTDTYVAGQSGTAVVPAGATSVTITANGGSGAGGFGDNDGMGTDYGGGGGGSGGWVQQTLSLNGGDTGTGISFSVGNEGQVCCTLDGGNSTVSGSVSGGGIGINAGGAHAGTTGVPVGPGGSAGGASGGDTNIAGGAGGNGGANSPGTGASPAGSGTSQGGDGGVGISNPGTDGSGAFISFAWN